MEAIKTKQKNSKDGYIEKIGRRKEATARVRLTPASKTEYTINNRKLEEYFPVLSHQLIVKAPFKDLETKDNFSITIMVSGGGINAQAEAIRLGISRALIEKDPATRDELKKKGYLKRDARKVERKKFGLRKARRRKQWRKR